LWWTLFTLAPLQHKRTRDNTNWRAGRPGGLEGRVSKWKRRIYATFLHDSNLAWPMFCPIVVHLLLIGVMKNVDTSLCIVCHFCLLFVTSCVLLITNLLKLLSGIFFVSFSADCCTQDRRTGLRAAQKKRSIGLRKRAALRPVSFFAAQLNVQPARPPLCAAHLPILWCSLPARPSVQLASPRKIHVFHLATQPSSPPFSVIQELVVF